MYLLLIVVNIGCLGIKGEESVSNDSSNEEVSEIRKILNNHLHQDQTNSMDPWSFFRNPELGDHFEGDIIRPPGASRRTFMKQARIWSEGIVPFHIDRAIKNNPRAMAVLLNSMHTISNSTQNCIQFYPLTSEQIKKYPQIQYVSITSKSPGCFADVGQSVISNQPTTLNLNVEHCFNLPGNSLHELTHILGQAHEHMRPDRDQHIKILWDHVAEESRANFELLKKQEAQTFDFPYDYDSITHYSRTAFSQDPARATLIPLKPGVTVGQRTHLSEIDIQKLKKVYKCDPNRPHVKLEDVLELFSGSQENKNVADVSRDPTPEEASTTESIPLHRWSVQSKSTNELPKPCPESSLYPVSKYGYFVPFDRSLPISEVLRITIPNQSPLFITLRPLKTHFSSNYSPNNLSPLTNSNNLPNYYSKGVYGRRLM